MEKEINELMNLFLKIKEKGWIKSKRKGSTGIGYTFECLINKKEDSMQIPDYKSIEIKTIRNDSKKRIHLFSTVPDGEIEKPLIKILNVLGYPSKKKNCKRACNITIETQKYTPIGYYKKAILINNYKKEKLDIKIIKNGSYVDLKVSWSYKKIREIINKKIRFLAIVYADNKYMEGEEYFKYVDIHFYQIKGYYTFIDLIDKGIINLSFQLEETNENRLIDRGTNFSINEKNINLLYYRIK